jgi:site-specific DNA recombinase
MTAPVRAALYLRVSTGRQADNDLSIPDQRRQATGYCTSRGWEIVADYVEPGVSATDDRRPEFQRMIDAATTKPPAFDMIVVHSFSRFFRDQFQLEFYVRRLAKSGLRLVSITQELGDDPMSNMIRQIMALFDEYQSKENAKHTLRAMKENARQGFWNGSLPPIGYRIVEAAEQHGHRTKKTLEIDPFQAETVRLIFRLAREGDGATDPMGVKSITKHLNVAGIRTRDGYRRDYLRALAQRVEVDAKELRIMGCKSELLRTLVAASSAKTAGFGVPSSVPKWRARGDSNL